MNDLMNLGCILTLIAAGIVWGMLAGRLAARKSLSGRHTFRLVVAPFVLLAFGIVAYWLFSGSSLMRDLVIALLPALVLAQHEAYRISHPELLRTL